MAPMSRATAQERVDLSSAEASAEAPAPTRRERKKERTRRAIFAAAMGLYAERRVDEVTVEQICQAADVARGTFFAHFPSKSALLFEFSREMTAGFRERLSEPRGSAIAELRALVAHLADAWLERADAMTSMLREFLVAPPSLAEVEAESHDLPALIEDIVRRGQARGEFRTGVPPRLAAAVFLSTSLSILSGHVYAEGETTPERAREQFLEVVLHGLVAGSESTPRDPIPSLQSRTPR